MFSTSVLGTREGPDEKEGGGGGPGVVAVASKSVIAGRKILKARSRRKKPAAAAAAAAPAAGDGGAQPRTPADWEAAVRGIYAAHNPAKLDNVPDLLAKYKGHEATLVDKLRAKYNVAAPVPAPTVGAFAGFDLCAAASGNSSHTSPTKSAVGAPMLEFKLVTSPPALASVAPHAPAAAAATAAAAAAASSSSPSSSFPAVAAAASSAIPLAQRGPRMAVLAGAGAGAGAGAAQLARWDTAFRVHWESSQHRSVVVLVFDAGGEGEGAEQLLLHKRSGDLDCYGGYWDGSAGGDVLLEDYAFDAAAGGAGPAEEAARADGAYRRAARRKLQHELGLGGGVAAAAAAAGEEEGGAGALQLEEWQTLAPAGTRNAHTRVFIARVPNLGAVAAAAPARADGGIAELRLFSSDSFRALLEVGTLVRPQLLEVLGRLNTAAPASVAFRKQEPFSAPSGSGGGGHKMIRLENDLIDDTKTEDKTSLRFLSEQRARLGFSPTALGAGASASDAK
jgi:hypothetical protein